jgi:hypothetical protein
MQHPVMRPPEPENLQLMIGVADEIAIGKEQKLDDIPAQIAGPLSGGSRFGRPRIRVGRRVGEIYVSHIDISWVQCYKTVGRDETLSRFSCGKTGRKKPELAAMAANLSTVRLSSGIRQTYWTSAFHKSMS